MVRQLPLGGKLAFNLLTLQNDLQVLLKELGGEDGIQQAVGVFSIVAADDAACD